MKLEGSPPYDVVDSPESGRNKRGEESPPHSTAGKPVSPEKEAKGRSAMMNWKIFALGSALFAGMTAVLAKIGVKNISSNMATLIRTIIIMVFLSVIIGIRREWKNPFVIDKQSLLFLVLSGITTGLSWLCYFRALQAGPASLVAPIDKLSLVFVIILSLLFLGERLGATQWIGLCLMTSGALIITLK